MSKGYKGFDVHVPGTAPVSEVEYAIPEPNSELRDALIAKADRTWWASFAKKVANSKEGGELPLNYGTDLPGSFKSTKGPLTTTFKRFTLDDAISKGLLGDQARWLFEGQYLVGGDTGIVPILSEHGLEQFDFDRSDLPNFPGTDESTWRALLRTDIIGPSGMIRDLTQILARMSRKGLSQNIGDVTWRGHGHPSRRPNDVQFAECADDALLLLQAMRPLIRRLVALSNEAYDRLWEPASFVLSSVKFGGGVLTRNVGPAAFDIIEEVQSFAQMLREYDGAMLFETTGPANAWEKFQFENGIGPIFTAEDTRPYAALFTRTQFTDATKLRTVEASHLSRSMPWAPLVRMLMAFLKEMFGGASGATIAKEVSEVKARFLLGGDLAGAEFMAGYSTGRSFAAFAAALDVLATETKEPNHLNWLADMLRGPLTSCIMDVGLISFWGLVHAPALNTGHAATVLAHSIGQVVRRLRGARKGKVRPEGSTRPPATQFTRLWFSDDCVDGVDAKEDGDAVALDGWTGLGQAVIHDGTVLDKATGEGSCRFLSRDIVHRTPGYIQPEDEGHTAPLVVAPRLARMIGLSISGEDSFRKLMNVTPTELAWQQVLLLIFVRLAPYGAKFQRETYEWCAEHCTPFISLRLANKAAMLSELSVALRDVISNASEFDRKRLFDALVGFKHVGEERVKVGERLFNGPEGEVFVAEGLIGERDTYMAAFDGAKGSLMMEGPPNTSSWARAFRRFGFPTKWRQGDELNVSAEGLQDAIVSSVSRVLGIEEGQELVIVRDGRSIYRTMPFKKGRILVIGGPESINARIHAHLVNELDINRSMKVVLATDERTWLGAFLDSSSYSHLASRMENYYRTGYAIAGVPSGRDKHMEGLLPRAVIDGWTICGFPTAYTGYFAVTEVLPMPGEPLGPHMTVWMHGEHQRTGVNDLPALISSAFDFWSKAGMITLKAPERIGNGLTYFSNVQVPVERVVTGMATPHVTVGPEGPLPSVNFRYLICTHNRERYVVFPLDGSPIFEIRREGDNGYTYGGFVSARARELARVDETKANASKTLDINRELE